MRIRIIGAGLAGSECAYALARRGHSVDLHEMRPVKTTPAHATSSLAELVCSNSFRSSAPTNAVGLLKQEMRLMESMVIRCGEEARVPALEPTPTSLPVLVDAHVEAVLREPKP